MSTDAQIRANRENARKSTGPRSEEGKARSRQNAVTHGLTGTGAGLPEADRAALAERADAWAEGLAPRDEHERWLVENAALASLRIEQVARREAQLRAARVERVDWDHAAQGRLAVLGAARRLGTDPESAYLELKSTYGGCRWLIERLGALEDLLRIAGSWTAGELDLVLELTGRDPNTRYPDRVAIGLRCCNEAARQVPTAAGELSQAQLAAAERHRKRLAGELPPGPGPNGAPLPVHVTMAMVQAGNEALAEYEREHLPPEELYRREQEKARHAELAEAGRAALREFVAEQLERLHEWSLAMSERPDFDRAEARAKALCDDGEAGARLRRYEADATRALHKSLQELRASQRHDRPRAEASPAPAPEPASPPATPAPSPSKDQRKPIPNSKMRRNSRPSLPSRNEPDPPSSRPTTPPAARRERPARNEANHAPNAGGMMATPERGSRGGHPSGSADAPPG